MRYDAQGTFADINDEYAEFVAKFKPKKTTDDCYTPENIYKCVKAWAVKRYGLEGREIVRPFWPGGDFEAFDYPDGCVVIDNPPFSIITRIVRFYARRGVDFFLFSPGLTLSGNDKCNHVCTGVSITYQNGAKVNTGFVTSLGEFIIESAPDLAAELDRIDLQNQKAGKKTVRKIRLPDEVLTRARMNYLAVHGVRLAVRRGDAAYTHDLYNCKVFGGCFLLSERAAAERAAAERAAAERAAAERAAAERAAAERAAAEPVELSEREKAIVGGLGNGEA
jgi:hypothetical protein